MDMILVSNLHNVDAYDDDDDDDAYVADLLGHLGAQQQPGLRGCGLVQGCPQSPAR